MTVVEAHDSPISVTLAVINAAAGFASPGVSCVASQAELNASFFGERVRTHVACMQRLHLLSDVAAATACVAFLIPSSHDTALTEGVDLVALGTSDDKWHRSDTLIAAARERHALDSPLAKDPPIGSWGLPRYPQAIEIIQTSTATR